MLVVSTIAEVRSRVAEARRAGQRIGFVPTMGYLHEGHLMLMRQARQECGFVLVSIFVNPTQFGPNEDFARYPRDLERDLSLCGSVPVDLVFAPSVEEIYPQPYLTRVSVSLLTTTLCGASRPGHFEGVATVVSKLLNIAQPDTAYFGQKDAQQVAVIRQMVTDLNLPVKISAVPTVREPDGLAMSSRNVYLTPEQRQAALVLSRSLHMAGGRVARGDRDLPAIRQAMQEMIRSEPLAELDYAEIVDPRTLQPLQTLPQGGQALAAVAVRFGRTRLIDNMTLQG